MTNKKNKVSIRYFLNVILLLSSIIVLIYSCEGPQGPAGKDANLPDVIPPQIYWIHPVGGDTLRSNDTLEVTAFDNSGIDSIVFFINGIRNFRNVPLSIRTTSNQTSLFRLPWNTQYLALGTYTLEAFAYDLSGNIGRTPTIFVHSNYLLSGIQWLQNYTGTSSNQGYNLPDDDGTTEYAVEFSTARSCSLMAFSFIAALPMGQATFPDLKLYIYSKSNNRPHIRLDSLDIPSTSIQPNLNHTIITLPIRYWQANESFFFSVAATSSQRVILVVDNSPSVGRDWYFIPSTNTWLHTPVGNLMFRVQVNYGP
ncbi:MAG: Ig-like domain-containing protein [bacterium]|nr:Ig-like domain-containing protein [bacterium]